METPPIPTAARLATGQHTPQQSSSVSANLRTTARIATATGTPTEKKRKLLTDAPTIAEDSVRSSRDDRHLKARKHAKHHQQDKTPSRGQAQGQRTAETPVTASHNKFRPPSPRIRGVELKTADEAEEIVETIVCRTTTAVAPPPPKVVSKTRWGRARRDVERIHSDNDARGPAAAAGVPHNHGCELQIQIAQYGADATKTPESVAVEVKLDQLNDDGKNNRFQGSNPAQNGKHNMKALDPKQRTPIIIDLTGELEPQPPTIIDLTAIDSPFCSNGSITVPESSHKTSNGPAQHTSERASLPTLANICNNASHSDSRSSVPQPPQLRFADLVTSLDTKPLSKMLEGPNTSHSSFVGGLKTRPGSSDHNNDHYLPSSYSQAPDKNVSRNTGAIPSVRPSKWRQCMPTFPISAGPSLASCPPTSFNRFAVIQDIEPISCYMPPIIDESKLPSLRATQAVSIVPSRFPGESGPVSAGSGRFAQNQHQRHQPPAQYGAPQSQREPVISQQFAPAVAVNSQGQPPAARQLVPPVEQMSMPHQSGSIITTNRHCQQISAQFAFQRPEPMSTRTQQFGPLVPIPVHRQSTVVQQNAVHLQTASQRIPGLPLSNTNPSRANRTPPLLAFEAEQLRKSVGSQPFGSSDGASNSPSSPGYILPPMPP